MILTPHFLIPTGTSKGKISTTIIRPMATIRLKENAKLRELAEDEDQALYRTTKSNQVIQFYYGRGKMENFIKEGKSGFYFAAVSSSSELVNANRLQIHALAYNLFNWFRRLALAAPIRKNSTRHR